VQQSGTIRELWRFPVKSMGGERLDAALVTGRGVVGDRAWAVREVDKAVISSGKRLPALMMCAARYVGDPGGDVAITLPDGAEVRSDDPDVHRRLSDVVGRAVTLCPLRPASDHDFYRAATTTEREMREFFAVEAGEPLPDFSMLPAAKLAELYRYATPPGTYFDAYALHVVTTSSLAAIAARIPGSVVDVRRFRPNLVLDDGRGAPDADWSGGVLRGRELIARIEAPTVRCAMPTRPQPGLAADRDVLRAIATYAGRCLGVYATVVQGGRVAVGDPMVVEPAAGSPIGAAMKAGATALKRLALRAAARTLPDE
jgi:uncharacterized protein